MTTTLEAIYENGVFRPVSEVPENLREHERVSIIIKSEIHADLESEFAEWETASDEDFLTFEKALEEKS